jgi:PAS domain S-box-containing protein
MEDVSASTLVSRTIESHGAELVGRWTANIRKADPAAAETILRLLATEIENKYDLLAHLGRLSAAPEGVTEQQLETLVDNVCRSEYSIGQLFTEIDALREAFDSVVPRSKDLQPGEAARVLGRVHVLLSQFLAKAAERKTSVYDRIIETGPQGLCEIDANGRLLYANRAMANLIEVAIPAGGRLAELFCGGEQDQVAKAIEGAMDGTGTLRGVEVACPRRAAKRLWLSIHPVRASGKATGAYLTATDISFVSAREERFLDRFGLAAIKLNQDLVITYANPATMTLLGSDEDIRGRSIFEIFPDTRTMSNQFEKRIEGKGDVYETKIVRPSDRKEVPVSVAGTPILDSQGNYLGTLGIIRSLERERAAEAIGNVIDTERDATALLEALAKRLLSLVPFDSFGVSQYSQSSEHISRWFNYSTDGGQIKISRRWWPISPAQKEEIAKPVTIPDIEAYVRKFWPALLDDATVRGLLAQGFRSSLRIPICQENRVVASLSLMSKQEGRYSQADLDLLLSLPVEQAVQTAFFHKSRRDFDFRYELLQEMERCQTAKDLAGLLVKKLAAHYEWDHVTISAVCRTENVFKDLAETSIREASMPRPRKPDQPLTAGVMGHVYRTRAPISIPNMAEHDLCQTFVRSWAGTQSELCVPIMWDGDVQWILDVEDDRTDAFSKDEERDVATILAEVELILARISRQYLLESALVSTSDTVVVTDTQGTILEANPAAAKLLGYENPAELRGPLQRIFKDSQAALKLLATTDSAAAEVDLLKKDGTSIAVLISGSNLPEDLFRKIFVAKDLTVARRLERLEVLRKLFQEVALQTHTPLSMVETWVRRAAESDSSTDLYTKILTQLRKLEITYDRLALSVDCGAVIEATRLQPIDLGVELKRAKEELPEMEQRIISYDDPGELPYIPADPGQISFMFSTILSYLVRLCAGDENCIRISAGRTGNAISVAFSSSAPLPLETGGRDSELCRARFELALGEPTIRRFAENNQAIYERTSDTSGLVIRLEFRMLRLEEI